MYRYKPKEKKYVRLKNALSLIFIMALVSVLSILLYRLYMGIEINPLSILETNEVNYTLTRTLEQSKAKSKEIEDLIAEASKSVVGISKIKSVGNSIFLTNGTADLGLGTGTIVTENGYILTNEHVSGGKYSTCYVTLENGTTYNGNVVWADGDIDLAVVKINAKNLKYVNLGDSDSIKVGEATYAIGNPIGFEFQRTVTAGIISATNRTIKLSEEKESYMEGLIQTDASINSGNSGGPLINLNGEAIGINSVKITSAEGIGFAIPVNIVKPIIEKFIKNKTFEEAYLGIFAYDREVIPYLDSVTNFNKGIYIAQIVLDGPCANLGLKIGDIITKIDQTEINTMSELRTYIYSKNPNDEVSLYITRNNKEYVTKVTLGRKG